MTPGSQHNTTFLNRFDSKRDKIDDTIDAGLAGSILGAGGAAITMRYRNKNLLGIAKRIASSGGVGAAAGASTEVVTNVVKKRHEKKAEELKTTQGHLKSEYIQTPVKQAEGKKVDPIKSYNKYIEKIAEMKNRDHKSISSSFLTGATYGVGASLIADGISAGSARRSMHYLKKNPAGTVHWLGRHLNDVNAKSKLRSLMERKPGRSAKWGLIAGGTAAGINAIHRLTDKN